MAHIKGAGPLTAEEFKNIKPGDTIASSRLPQDGNGWKAIMGKPRAGAVYSGPVFLIEGGDAKIQSVPCWM